MRTSCRSLDLLHHAMVRNNTLLCCGLDPDVSKLPTEFSGLDAEEAVHRFLKVVIDLTAPYVCAYKAQKAFFDILPAGHQLLKQVIGYVHDNHPQLPVFIDAKIGDVDNTMEIYLRNILDELGADGVVVNPYLGDEVMAPFRHLRDKAAIVTVRTSNPGSAVVQELILSDGRPLWLQMLTLVVEHWNKAGNMVPVIASTSEIDLQLVRKTIPDEMPILFAGFGAQGGSVKNLRDLLDSTGCGVFVNSSRGLLYPYEPHDAQWREAVVRATEAARDRLNFERSRSKFLLLLGVSGVGKSTLIQELRKLDPRFVYISPFMTRGLRSGEKDKQPVEESVLNEMERKGQFLVVNEVYGIKYATPREPIERAFREERFPVLDWPIKRLDVMLTMFPGRLFTVYVDPPNIETLHQRLSDGRDPLEERFDSALEELQARASGAFDSLINYSIINHEDDAPRAARLIYDAYLKSMKR